MSFLNPIFLFALLTVAVPLLIYLLNIRKPKKVRFSTLAFFDSLQTTALKRIRIKRWLLLATRCLAILALVFAASRPFLPPELGWADQSEAKVIGILIDNSPSMDRVDQNGPYLEQALGIAKELIEMTEGDARFSVNVGNGQSLNIPILSKSAAIRRVDEISTSNTGNFLRQRLQNMKSDLLHEEEPNKIIYLITDAQESQFVSLEEEDSSDQQVFLQAITVGNGSTSNLGFEEVRIETGQGSSVNRPQLRNVIKNFGNQPVSNAFVSLSINQELISQQSFNLAAGQSEEFLFEIPSLEERNIPVELLIEGDELSFDNHFYAAIRQPGEKQVLMIHESRTGSRFHSYLQPLLNAASEQSERFHVDFRTYENLETSLISNYDAIILDGLREIPDYLIQSLVSHAESGGGLLFMPSADGSLNSYNRFLNYAGVGRYSNIVGDYGSFEAIDRIAEPNDGHPMLDNVFENAEGEIRLNVPEIFYYYAIETSGSDITVLRSRTGSPMIVESRVGNGRVIYSAIGSDPGWSNFPIKPFFAPFFFRTIDYLMEGERAELQTHVLGEAFQAELSSGRQNILLNIGDEAILPDIRQTFQGITVSYSAEEWEPGWMELNSENEIFLYGLNQHAMESELVSLTEEQLENMLRTSFQTVRVTSREGMTGGLGSELQSATFGREIWYWFILAAFILLVTESIISRHYKIEQPG